MDRKSIAGNTDTGSLKLIALVFMMVDHAGKMLCGNMTEMRVLGRLAFPLYCWCAVVGMCYTKHPPKYILRVLLVGLVSQPINMLALNHTWTEPCVFLTLVLGLLALWGMRESRWGSQVWMPVLAMCLAAWTGTDYGWRGVLLMILLYMARGSRTAIAAVMIAMSLFWGSTSSTVNSLFGVSFSEVFKLPGIGAILPSFLRLQGLMLLSLPLMLVRTPDVKRIRLPKWFGYGVYPAHLVVLYILELVMGCAQKYPVDLIQPILKLFGV